MFSKDEYFSKEEDLIKVYYDPNDGSLVKKYNKEEDSPWLEADPKDFPDVFPFEWIGPHYIDENHSIVDRRVKRFEYKVDLDSKEIKRFDYVEEYLEARMGHEEVLKFVEETLDEDYRRISKKTDFIAVEYYKKQILPEYTLEVKDSDIAELKKYPIINKKYKEAKKWLASLTTEIIENASKRKETIDKIVLILSNKFLDV
jgi:hypothetical protein